MVTAANVNDVHNLDITVNAGDITLKIDGNALILTKSSGGRRGFGPPRGGGAGAPDEGSVGLQQDLSLLKDLRWRKEDFVLLSSNSVPAGTYEAVTTDSVVTKHVNQLFNNIRRSQLGDFFNIPTDCPQRNERMGWTGDAQAYLRTATYNADVRNFYRQWMVALRNDQFTTWGNRKLAFCGSAVEFFHRFQTRTSLYLNTSDSVNVCYKRAFFS
jgi:hypothetical protein